MATMMQSIMENASQDRQYKFFVLHRDIKSNSIELLRKQITCFARFSIDFIDVSQYVKEYNLFVSRHLTVETYFRLLIPYLLSDYNKALYFDGDMICRIDVADLFDINLGNNLVAAVRDIGVLWYYNPEHTEGMKSIYELLLSLRNPENYFNAGMCVLNIEQFRNTLSIKELFDLAQSREWQVHDQDILNYLAEGKTLLLPFEWDFMRCDDLAMHLPENLRKEYIAAEQNPKIIHYKPWSQSQRFTRYFELFWNYAVKTPFIDMIIDRMCKEEIKTTKFRKDIIFNIKHREGLGLRFIIDCFKAWLFRDKIDRRSL
jgi:lipopolysaccharide biosynthesis glycosyltransferase